MKFMLVDTHPEGGCPLSEAASLAIVCTFATAHEVKCLTALKVGEVYVHQPESQRGIQRVE